MHEYHKTKTKETGKSLLVKAKTLKFLKKISDRDDLFNVHYELLHIFLEGLESKSSSRVRLKQTLFNPKFQTCDALPELT